MDVDAIDAESKLIAGYHVGTRDAGCAYEFTTDLVSRIETRVQLTPDGLNAYINAVADAFGPSNIGNRRHLPAYGMILDADRRRLVGGCRMRRA